MGRINYIKSKKPIFPELFLNILQFLNGKGVQKCQFVSKNWNSWIKSNFSTLPLFEFYCFQLKKDGEFTEGLSYYASDRLKTNEVRISNERKEKKRNRVRISKEELNAQAPNKKFVATTELKPCEKSSPHKYLVRYFEISNGDCSTKSPINILKNFENNMKQFNNRLKVIELYVKLEVLNPQDKFLEDITVLLNNYLDIEHLYLDISGGIVIGDISPNFARPIRVNIWKSFCLPPFYSKLSIGWCVNARSEELVEWMGDWEWAPEGSKKFMDLREAILLGDFIQEYIEFFIKTKNPNHMFKEVLYGSDGELSIPHEYLSQNNIPCRRFYPYCRAGYRYLIETDPNNTEHGLKALIEATRPDGFILRILANNIIRAGGVQFKVYHKDYMPRPTIPEWVKFPQAPNQLGFDYLNHNGGLI